MCSIQFTLLLFNEMLFLLHFFVFYSSHVGAASDVDTLNEWIRGASTLGIGATETNALNALKDILESSPSDSKRILGMGQGESGVERADQAVLRRLNVINAGVNSPNVRRLGELAGIALRAKKKLWIDGYDRETDDVEEDQDNAKRKVKLVLTKLEERKESDLFEKIKPIDYKQLRDMDDAYTTKRFKDIQTDLGRRSVAELPGGLSQALKDAAEYVNIAYSTLALEVGSASDLPESVRKSIRTMREVNEVASSEDKRVLAVDDVVNFDAIDEAYRRRVEAANLNDENVMTLHGLVASLRFITLRTLNTAYEELAKNLPEYRAVGSAIIAMKPIEGTVYDLDTFGLKSDPDNAIAFDGAYFTRAEGISRRNEQVRRHFGLKLRAEEAIKKLNNDFDSVAKRKPALFMGEPKRAWEQLAELDGKADLNQFGNPLTLAELDSKYARRMQEINGMNTSDALREYKGLKLRSELSKERFSRAYFLVSDNKGITSSSETNSNVQKVLRRSSEILSKTNWTEILENPEMTEDKIEEAFRKRMEELDRQNKEVTKLPGLNQAMEVVVDRLKLARQVLIDKVRPPAPIGPGSETPEQQRRREEEEERRRAEEMIKELDKAPPKEISDECRDEAPNCHENTVLCKNHHYVALMHSACRKTCAVCMQSGGAANCEDRNTEECQQWGRAFCDSAIYSKGMKMQQCAKYCGLCPDSAG